MHPPSFAQSEFETIIRRQKTTHALKIVNIPSRFPNLDNDWEFAGWGSMRYLELHRSDLQKAEAIMSRKPKLIDQFRASSIAGNGVLGSVFYAFPQVAAVSSVLSPISLAVACLILFLYQPIMVELGSALKLNGANYIYLLQFSGKTMGLIGAAATFLDAVATSTVSSATASEYLRGEFAKMPIPMTALTIMLLVAFCLVGLFNVRESSTVTLSFTVIHVITMVVLMIFGVISWVQNGSEVLKDNWKLRPTGGLPVIRAIFDGICIGFLGLTGFECTPGYIEVIAERKYSSVLRNMLVSALLLNAPLMLIVYAQLPEQDILSGSNILSLLAERVAGKWLRYLLVVDAGLVLCGGILAGLFTATGLLETLSRGGVIPAVFHKAVPATGGLAAAAALFLVSCVALFATSAGKLATLSGVFSVSFLVVMLLYGISNILLKFSRDRLPRLYRANLWTVLFTIFLTLTCPSGQHSPALTFIRPVVLGLFAPYFIIILLGLFTIQSQARLARIAIWLYDQTEVFRNFQRTRGLDFLFVKAIRRSRRHAICVWVKGDDIYHLVESILYVRHNEPTARIIFIHAYQTIEEIPSELAPNVRILDEGFPSITIELVFVQGHFSPALAQAVSVKLDIPRTNMFMSCPGLSHKYRLADYQGLRVIHH
ncbi:amino acid permease-domain-containing protein [Mycena floridula]|nr:amino acid permease-domain-containing protein [Mycena floridula]